MDIFITVSYTHLKGPKKCTEEDDERFAQSFEKMIRMAKSKEELRNTDR